VPFALGRPLGTAGDTEFQKNVLRASFEMLQSAVEPTIEDYPIEAPVESGSSDWSCPVSFAVAEDESISARILAEINLMAPWSAETRATRGRTLFGVTGAGPDQVEQVARALGEIADHGNVTDLPAVDISWQFEMPLLIRHMVDDLRTFYHEAVAAQPGDTSPSHEALNDWIFSCTALGDGIQAIAKHLTHVGDGESLMTRGFLVPEGYLASGGSSFPTPAEIQENKKA
jgi:hypothetical protein